MGITRIALIWLVLGSLAAPVSAQRSQRGQQGWIGISIDIRADEGRARRGASVVIGEVRSGSPAAEAGLRAGDRLVAIGDLRGADDFRNLPERLRLSVGERVRIRIERDGRRRDVVVRAAERPADLRSRTVLLPMEPDSMVEVMMRAMDSLRVQITEVRGNVQRGAEAAGRLRVVREDSQTSFDAPFEFFVFRGEEHDSLRKAMEDLNRMSEELRQQEQLRIQELSGVTSRRGNVQAFDEELQKLRSELEGVTRQSATLRTAMSEAARVTAGFEYTLPAVPQTPRAVTAPPDPPEFRPLTPYLLGSDRVAGAQVVDLRPELARYFAVDGGVLIVDVSPGTPAAMAGLLPGDVVTRLDQVTVRSVEELRFGVSRSGESLPLRLVRQGTTLEVLLSRR